MHFSACPAEFISCLTGSFSSACSGDDQPARIAHRYFPGEILFIHTWKHPWSLKQIKNGVQCLFTFQ